VRFSDEEAPGRQSTTSTVTSTFLFTDIEGSTRLLQAVGEAYPRLLEEHRRLIRAAVAAHGGRTFGSEGDALFAVFGSASDALAAAAEAQRALAAHVWPAGSELRVRMGIHSGEVVALGDDDYVGLALHQAARVTGAGHGGQVLVSSAARELAATVGDGLELRDLGQHRLKDLAMPERLYQLVGPGLADAFPPLKTLNARPNNLPVQLTSFVGREELAAARRALDATRLLTLSGPGGTGKTRLALQLAADASDDFADGVFFVPLETVRDPEMLASAIGATLGLADSPGVEPFTRLVDHLRERRMLLVLDNFEQIVDAGETVARLLREASNAKAIVTSRVVLRVYGEHEFPVPPLGLPAPTEAADAETATRSEAVRLFVERAMAVRPDFRLTAENAPAVVEIVRAMDGLPLAIELAAARTRILSVAAIRSRLGQRLALLTGGARDLPGRQQTLRGAIDWSYDLLEQHEQRLFERFAVFVGGAALRQADAVCRGYDELGTDTLDGLSSLADKSLIRASLTEDEDPRFAMLVTIRDYALERAEAASDWAEIRQRHARAYVELAETAAPKLSGVDRRRWLDRLERDHDNFLAVLDWAVGAMETETALRMIAAIWRYWQGRGHLYVGRDWVARVTAMPGVGQQPPALQARAYAAAGGISYWQGDFPQTHRHYARALEQARRSDDRRVLAEALYNFGFAPTPDFGGDYAGYYAAGRSSLLESLRLYQELGDLKGVADANWALALAAGAERDYPAAIRHAEESLGLYRAEGDLFGTAWAAHQLALYLDLAGQRVRAMGYLAEAMRLFVDASDQSGIQLVLTDFAQLSLHAGKTERAMRLAGAAEAMRDITGVGLDEASASFMGWEPLQPPTTDAERMRMWQEGRRMTPEQAMAYAMEQAVER
jgi:predicted ATPase/class 3 adenylate cyclase